MSNASFWTRAVTQSCAMSSASTEVIEKRADVPTASGEYDAAIDEPRKTSATKGNECGILTRTRRNSTPRAPKYAACATKSCSAESSPSCCAEVVPPFIGAIASTRELGPIEMNMTTAYAPTAAHRVRAQDRVTSAT